MKDAAKAAGITLEPPKTWDQFDALVKFFNGKDVDGDGQPEAGLSLAWGSDAEGVADSILLSRIAALGLHKDEFTFLLNSDTTEPRVTTPPFVEGFKAYLALKSYGPAGSEGFNADKAREAFRSKKAVFLIDRAEKASTWGTEGTAIGTAPLPGSARVFDFTSKSWENVEKPNHPTYLPGGGGWLAGVFSATTNKAAAEDFVKYLASPETSGRLRSEKTFPMLPTRSSQFQEVLLTSRSAPGVEPRSWTDAVRKSLTAERVSPGPRFPGAVDYLTDFTRARLAGLAGQPVEPTLNSLASAWSEKTRSRGLARQTWHHRRSLTGLITSPEPPAK